MKLRLFLCIILTFTLNLKGQSEINIPGLSEADKRELDEWAESIPDLFYTTENERYIYHYKHAEKPLAKFIGAGTEAKYQARRYYNGDYTSQDIGNGLYAFPNFRGQRTRWGGGRYQNGNIISVIKIKKNIKMMRWQYYDRTPIGYKYRKRGTYYLFKKYKFDALELPHWPLVMVGNPDIINSRESFYIDFGRKEFRGKLNKKLLEKNKINLKGFLRKPVIIRK